MKANRNTGTNEIRPLSTTELDAVSGGKITRAFDFTVAGMHITGGYDSGNGNYGVVVETGKEGQSGYRVVAQGGTV